MADAQKERSHSARVVRGRAVAQIAAATPSVPVRHISALTLRSARTSTDPEAQRSESVGIDTMQRDRESWLKARPVSIELATRRL